jgi:hypothetical protein
MSAEPCPSCGDTKPTMLDYSTKISTVNYYRCEKCKHVWTTDRETGKVATHITPLLEPNEIPPSKT